LRRRGAVECKDDHARARSGAARRGGFELFLAAGPDRVKDECARPHEEN